MGRMQAEADRDSSTGVVGVRLDHDNHVWGEHAVEFLAFGTAVRDTGTVPEPPTPMITLGLT